MRRVEGGEEGGEEGRVKGGEKGGEHFHPLQTPAK